MTRIVKERLDRIWEPAVTKHRAEAVKRQLEAAAAAKEAGGDSSSPSPTDAASGARTAKMRKENADAEVDALNSLDKKFRDSNGGGDPGRRKVDGICQLLRCKCMKTQHPAKLPSSPRSGVRRRHDAEGRLLARPHRHLRVRQAGGGRQTETLQGDRRRCAPHARGEATNNPKKI